MSSSFWSQLEELVETSDLVLDRPKGRAHPRDPSTIYPLDYGYLAGTSGGDGNEIDVWRGSLEDARVDAVVCTTDLVKRDSEVKVLLGCSPAEKTLILRFHRSHGMGALLVERDHRRPS
ncbi:MAG: inorganic pyrophosphatase [Planctomycetota bacterium]